MEYNNPQPSEFPGSSKVPSSERIEVPCPKCGLNWIVHQDLCGFRIRCRECGEAIAIKDRKKDLLGQNKKKTSDSLMNISPDTKNKMVMYRRKRLQGEGIVPDQELDEIEYLDIRKQILNRSFIELLLIMVALIGPGLVLLLSSTGSQRMILHPAASIISSISIIIIISIAGPHIYREIRSFNLIYIIESMIAVSAALLLAWIWLLLIDSLEYSGHRTPFDEMAEHWGWAGLVFTIGLCPGIFEELAFRGLLQNRFDLIFGRKKSILYTGIAFALCHTITLAFPIHLILGIYLCNLRFRSKSLIPGIIVHTLYNSLVIFF